MSRGGKRALGRSLHELGLTLPQGGLSGFPLRTRDTIRLILLFEAYAKEWKHLSGNALISSFARVAGGFAEAAGLKISARSMERYRAKLRRGDNEDRRGRPSNPVSPEALASFWEILSRFRTTRVKAHAAVARIAKQSGWHWPSLRALQISGAISETGGA